MTQIVKEHDPFEPATFGWRRDGSYDPSPEEIRERCEAIQATWPRRVESDRSKWAIEAARVRLMVDVTPGTK